MRFSAREKRKAAGKKWKENGKENGKLHFNAIAFGMGNFFTEIKKQPFHICYTINENNWNGKTDLQLNVKDIKV
jgi:single-stranded-DNA-specific exonuclease